MCKAAVSVVNVGRAGAAETASDRISLLKQFWLPWCGLVNTSI